MRIKGILLILLTVSLGTALAMTSKEQEEASDVVGAVSKNARKHGVSGNADQQPSDVHFDLSTIKRPIPKSLPTTGLFKSKSWYAPPPLPKAIDVQANVPPPQPAAPALPFVFIGRMLDGKEVTVFLTKNDNHYSVKEKDIVDNVYRVDKIGESEAVLTYLPTNTQQTLSFNTTPAKNALISASELKTAMLPGISSPKQPEPNN